MYCFSKCQCLVGLFVLGIFYFPNEKIFLTTEYYTLYGLIEGLTLFDFNPK